MWGASGSSNTGPFTMTAVLFGFEVRRDAIEGMPGRKRPRRSKMIPIVSLELIECSRHIIFFKAIQVHVSNVPGENAGGLAGTLRGK